MAFCLRLLHNEQLVNGRSCLIFMAYIKYRRLSTVTDTMPRFLGVIGSCLLTAGLLLALVGQINTAYAASGQLGQEQVTLNPGGGIQTNGSDGLRFTINSAAGGSGYDSAVAGQDGVVYRATRQYCCSAGAPMLNVGGTLYGQSGPAFSSSSWTSISILSTSGATSVGTRTSSTGDSSATIRYTAIKNSLTYTVDRVVTYTYPNDFVTDSYTFTIPDGNTETVKFYLGGDTAPGSSDQGYGIMLTSPVRSVISLNTSSQIMFGFREVQGDKVFDGATSQSYSAPYSTVQSGGNIGYVVTSATHDAGLMMQWSLGSTAGSQTATLQQFATQQGTNLNASFSANITEPNSPVNLNIQAVNTVLATANGIGYTATLPAGLTVDSSAVSNTCSGTLTANDGGSTIELSGASVAAATNCLVSVPVVASLPNTYTISSASFTSLANINNNVGTSALLVTDDNDGDGVSNATEDGAPNGGDANNDGTDDRDQENVTSIVNSATSEYTSLVVDNDCDLTSVSIKEENQLTTDDGHVYPLGLIDFTADCLVSGATTTVTHYYFNPPDDDFVPRKYANGTYQTLDDAIIGAQTVGSAEALVISYDVEDGGPLDDDGLANSEIVDPAGPAVVSTAITNSPVQSGNTGNETTFITASTGSETTGKGGGLADTGSVLAMAAVTTGLALAVGALILKPLRSKLR